jgi:hypothetical protein
MGIASVVRRTNKTPELSPAPPIQERVRRLPEAVLLTTGYYASRVPGVNGLIRRFD